MIHTVKPQIFGNLIEKIRITEYRKHEPVYTTEHIEKLLSKPIYSMKQVHGNTTLIIDENTPNWQEADAVITQSTNRAISVRWADCQNITLYDPSTNTVACIHSGWQGTVKNVVQNCITTLIQKLEIKPSNLLVYSGASLCKYCAEFSDPITELPDIDTQFFNGRKVDLVGITRQQLLDAGVLENHIELSNECTKCLLNTYWSYRGEKRVKEDSGLRNVTVVELL